MTRLDASDLATRLGREAEAVCRHYLDAGRRQGNYWQVGDARNTPGRSPSIETSSGRAKHSVPLSSATCVVSGAGFAGTFMGFSSLCDLFIGMCAGDSNLPGAISHRFVACARFAAVSR